MLIALVLIAQVQAAPAASRPAECGAIDGARGLNVWERAKHPELRMYCDLLASGSSKLAGSAAMAREVITIADDADKKMPGKLAPSVLRGRAFAKLGRYDDAYTTLAAVKAKDPTALDEAAALFAFGRAATRTNHADEAREAYRALLPRASVLPSSDRGPAYVEAGMLAMQRGPAGLDEAIAIFRQAERDAQDVAQTVAWLALALALDRSGSRDEAKAVLAQRPRADPRPALADARAHDLVATPAELDAMAGLGLEGQDAAAAREAWHKYTEATGANAAWVEHAKSHEGAAPKPKPKPSTAARQ